VYLIDISTRLNHPEFELSTSAVVKLAPNYVFVPPRAVLNDNAVGLIPRVSFFPLLLSSFDIVLELGGGILGRVQVDCRVERG
jgi:hypothetical protein